MGLMDQAKNLAGQHPDAVDKATEKAGDAVNERTDNKYSDQVHKAGEAAGGYLKGHEGGDAPAE